MSADVAPAVAIGMPVYNGERYVAEAIDSILAQTMSDFALVISDNGSTDGTEAICREYAARDARIRYERYEQNRGSAWNYNNAFAISDPRTPYFKWHACDDVLAPSFLERCVEQLEADASAVLAFAGVAVIDENGERVRLSHDQIRAGDRDVVHRVRRVLGTIGQNAEAFHGVIRRSAVAQTSGHGPHAASDKLLLCELALLGRFVEVPYVLFLNRDHPGRSLRQVPDPRARAAWLDPTRAGKVGLPNWRLALEVLRAIQRAPVSGAVRLRSWALLPYFAWELRRELVQDPIALGREAWRRRIARSSR